MRTDMTNDELKEVFEAGFREGWEAQVFRQNERGYFRELNEAFDAYLKERDDP